MNVRTYEYVNSIQSFNHNGFILTARTSLKAGKTKSHWWPLWYWFMKHLTLWVRPVH